MIVDQLFTPKPLQEGNPYDLPGIDYDRPGDVPRRPLSRGEKLPRRHPDDPDDFMDPGQRKLRADQERVAKAWADHLAKKKQSGVAEMRNTDDPMDDMVEDYLDYLESVGMLHKSREEEKVELLKDLESGVTHSSEIEYALSGTKWDPYGKGVAEGSLEEVDRRGFLKGLGAAAVAGAIPLGAKAQTQDYVQLANYAVQQANEIVTSYASVMSAQRRSYFANYIREEVYKQTVWYLNNTNGYNGKQVIDYALSYANRECNKLSTGIGDFIGGGGLRDNLAMKVVNTFIQTYASAVGQKSQEYRSQASSQSQSSDIKSEPVDTQRVVMDSLMLYYYCKGFPGNQACETIKSEIGKYIQINNQKDMINNLYSKISTELDSWKTNDQDKWNKLGHTITKDSAGIIQSIQKLNSTKKPEFESVEQGVAEEKQRRLNEALLLEDPVYRNFRRIGGYIAEQRLSQAQILQIFSDAEAGMTDRGTGANRTFLGRGKDATVDFAKDVAGAVKGVLNSIQTSVPVAAVDVAYDQATDALANLAGGQKGAVMSAINKYRNLVKQYPKTAGFAKAALVAIAGLATGGAGLPAIAGLTYALDSAIKGDKLSSVLGKGAGAAALAAAGQGAYGGATQTGPADTNAFTNVNQMGDYTGDYANMPDPSDSVGGLVDPTPDLATYTVQSGDTLSQIAQANDTTVQELVELNPQLAAASGATGGQSTNPDVLFPGQQITLPPGSPGADVYAGGVGTNANTMADIAQGQVPNSAITQSMANKANAVAQNTTSQPSAASDFGTGGNAPIDYTSPGPESIDSLGQKLEYGIPVNDKGSFVPPNPGLPPQELATQQAAYDAWKADFMRRFPNASPGPDGSMLSFKPGLAPMQILQKPTLPAAVQESVKIKKLPFEKLVDQKSTVLAWALNESVGRPSKSVHLSTIGTLAVFENIERYRQAIMELKGVPGSTRPEYYAPAMPGGPGKSSQPGMIGRGLNWLDKAAGKVGGALSNFGHQFTTNVTKEKLKMNWHQAGKPSDSDKLAAWLVGQGVPQEVVTSVYNKMSIPYTATAVQTTIQPTGQPDTQKAAPAKTGGASTQAYAGINPATKKPWTQQELRDKFYPEPAADFTAPAAKEQPPAPAAKEQPPAPADTKTTAGSPAGFNAGNIFKQPGMEKYAKPAAKPPAKTPNFAGPGGYGKTTMSVKPMTGVPGIKTTPAPTAAPAGTKVTTGGPTPDEQAKLAQRIAQATAKPVAEMLAMVETKEDVQRIKQFVDQTFVRYGAVTESAFVVRNQILEHVTHIGAQRRREHSQRVAT